MCIWSWWAHQARKLARCAQKVYQKLSHKWGFRTCMCIESYFFRCSNLSVEYAISEQTRNGCSLCLYIMLWLGPLPITFNVDWQSCVGNENLVLDWERTPNNENRPTSAVFKATSRCFTVCTLEFPVLFHVWFIDSMWAREQAALLPSVWRDPPHLNHLQVWSLRIIWELPLRPLVMSVINRVMMCKRRQIQTSAVHFLTYQI